MIHSIEGHTPLIHETARIAWNAEVAGEVTVSERCSVWFSATLRADVAPIRLGNSVNIQDNAVLHADPGMPCIIENAVTVGHGAILHSCTIGEGSTVGMGAIVLNGAVIGKNCMVAAGALVTQGRHFPDNSMIMGSPAKLVRELTGDEIAGMKRNNDEYARLGAAMEAAYRRIDGE